MSKNKRHYVVCRKRGHFSEEPIMIEETKKGLNRLRDIYTNGYIDEIVTVYVVSTHPETQLRYDPSNPDTLFELVRKTRYVAIRDSVKNIIRKVDMGLWRSPGRLL